MFVRQEGTQGFFLLAQKLDCSPPTLSLPLFRVMSEGQNALGWSLSVDAQTSEQQWLPEFQPGATHTGRVEEMQALRNTRKSFLKFTPYKDVYTFGFFFFFFTISYSVSL